MKKLLYGVSLTIPLLGMGALPGMIATASADQVTFLPDWPNHRNQTEKTICAALAQGWSRRQIVSTAEKANNYDLTGVDSDEAAERADAYIDAARYEDCPTLNAS
ncbi:hypothetical protein MAAFP003_4870 [Mycobacterium ahvazicum]|uniref:DUF732 domain-containing protein n=1 Tax=Mycobacterium ahvazicum TaxID=1964395 RepID=A0A2K4YHA8_9MYCO|nr:hypothetical protein [Mycobacterium ahvazicum]SOX56169.1 hypothetical protein MAAFP003_4870 [Mycobacterium ahvazicum]